MAELKITRKAAWGDRLRAYRIILDGNTIGKIKQNESLSYYCAKGEHRLSVKIDWCSTAKEFEIREENEVISFSCQSNISGWKVPLAFFFLFMPGKWVVLRRI